MTARHAAATRAETATTLGENATAVLECLRGARGHPTAAALYEDVRQRHPRIGRATVYRALARLEAAGLARSVGRDALGQHYDARIDRHDHAICVECGAVLDLSLPAVLPAATHAALSQAARAVGIAIVSYEIRLYGRCSRCEQANMAQTNMAYPTPAGEEHQCE